MVDIGFLEPTYTVDEAAGSAVVRFGVLSGNLQRDIDVSFTFSSGTATGRVDLNYQKSTVRK